MCRLCLPVSHAHGERKLQRQGSGGANHVQVRTRTRRLMMLMLLRGVLRLGSSKGKPPKTMTYRMMPIAQTSAVQASWMSNQRCRQWPAVP